MLQGRLKDVSMEFLVSFKGAKKKLNGCLREVSKVFQGSFKGVSMKIERSSLSPLRVVLWCFKVCKRSSKGVSRQFQRCFKEIRVFY